MKTLAIVAVCSLTLLACATTTTTTTTSNDAEAALRAANPPFLAAFNAGDWPTVASYYTEDAVFLMPSSDITRGRQAIQQSFSSFGAMKPNLSITPERIVQSCDVAYETGHYQMKTTAANGSAMTDNGKYLTVWRRQADGSWKIVADMINTNMPAPGM